MKKFLAIVFALIFALSACTVAFAADECSACHAVFTDAKAETAHMNGDCLIQFKACQFCGAKVRVTDVNGDALKNGDVVIDNLGAHEAECPKGASTCSKCNAPLANKAAADAHTCATEDVANNVLDKAIEALKEVDWKSLADKVVGVVKGIDFEGIIAKIKPLIEKVVDLVKGAAA